MKLKATFRSRAPSKLKATIHKNEKFSAKLDSITTGSGSGATVYAGEYEVVPKVAEQTLATRDKVMRKDVTVAEIPYFAVANESNGDTIIIGGV